ncbi:MAG: aspartate kinase [Bacteroidales bacterium]
MQEQKTILFKFGGASVKNAEAVRNMEHILNRQGEAPLLIVLSAMDKTTNALEELAYSYYLGKPDTPELFQKIKSFHVWIVKDLFEDQHSPYSGPVIQCLNELEEYLSKPSPGEKTPYDEVYDRIIPYGELLSTRIVSGYLEMKGFNHRWMDARDIIITGPPHRDATVNWDLTGKRIRERITPLIRENTPVLLPGFISGTVDGKPMTLGREGSDYTASILAYLLNANRCVVWKDVPGLLNADPKIWPHTEMIPRISYWEAIELSFYGAKVIHPKTIKPLQNKKIPLIIKSFLDPEGAGTIICEDTVQMNTPFYIFKFQQLLISISPRDYSFIAEDNLHVIFGILARHNVKANIMHNSALSFSICIDDDAKSGALLQDLSEGFIVRYNSGLDLITVRHYTQEVIQELTNNRKVFLEQRSRNTFQLVLQ